MNDPNYSYVYEAIMSLSRLAATVAETMDEQVDLAGGLLAECLLTGGKVLACGNGGSAAGAQHFAAELVGRMTGERRPLPAISLTSDTSVVTALSNDYSYENVFARQVQALGQSGDMLLALSTSGRSANVLRAIEVAQQREMRTIALTGEGGDALLSGCDMCIRIPSSNTQRIQELHTAVLHAMCESLERQMEATARDPRKSRNEVRT